MKPGIDNSEYAARHPKARVLMEKNSLTALLITEPTNLFQRFIIESDADFGWVIVCNGDYDPRQSAGSSQPDRRLKKLTFCGWIWVS